LKPVACAFVVRPVSVRWLVTLRLADRPFGSITDWDAEKFPGE
jgi:hypothetical protein